LILIIKVLHVILGMKSTPQIVNKLPDASHLKEKNGDFFLGMSESYQPQRPARTMSANIQNPPV